MDIKTYLMAPIPRWVALLTTISTGVAAGSTAYLYTKRKFEAEYMMRLDDEVAATKQFYTRINKTEYHGPEDAVAKLVPEGEGKLQGTPAGDVIEAFRDSAAGYLPEEEMDEAVEQLKEVAHNVFTDAEGTDFDFEAELPHRGADHPYILDFDEFAESEFTQISLTYYEEDGVLANERDEVVEDVNGTVGEDNLSRFGYGSKDNNIVYIRNEAKDVDFEVIRATGSYAEIVHGIIKHSGGDRQRVKRFRQYEDD